MNELLAFFPYHLCFKNKNMVSSHHQQCCGVCITKMWLGPRVALWWKLRAAAALRRVRGVRSWHTAFLNTRVCDSGHRPVFPEATSATLYAFLVTCIPLPSVFLLCFCADLSRRFVHTCCCSPWPASARGSGRLLRSWLEELPCDVHGGLALC